MGAGSVSGEVLPDGSVVGGGDSDGAGPAVRSARRDSRRRRGRPGRQAARPAAGAAGDPAAGRLRRRRCQGPDPERQGHRLLRLREPDRHHRRQDRPVERLRPLGTGARHLPGHLRRGAGLRQVLQRPVRHLRPQDRGARARQPRRRRCRPAGLPEGVRAVVRRGRLDERLRLRRRPGRRGLRAPRPADRVGHSRAHRLQDLLRHPVGARRLLPERRAGLHQEELPRRREERRLPLPQRRRRRGQRQGPDQRDEQARDQLRLHPGCRRLGVQLRPLRPADEGQGRQVRPVARLLPARRPVGRRDEAGRLQARPVPLRPGRLQPGLRRVGQGRGRRCRRSSSTSCPSRRPRRARR